MTKDEDRVSKLREGLLSTKSSSIECLEQSPSVLWELALACHKCDKNHILLLKEGIDRHRVDGASGRREVSGFLQFVNHFANFFAVPRSDAYNTTNGSTSSEIIKTLYTCWAFFLLLHLLHILTLTTSVASSDLERASCNRWFCL
jgi:hypothetical protein